MNMQNFYCSANLQTFSNQNYITSEINKMSMLKNDIMDKIGQIDNSTVIENHGESRI